MIEGLYYVEVNVFCGAVILFFGLMSLLYMSRIQKKVSRFMITMSFMYLAVVAFDTLQWKTGTDAISFYAGEGKPWGLLSLVFQILTASMWLAYVQNRSVYSERVRKVSVASGFVIVMGFLAFCLFSYFNKDIITSWEEANGVAGATVRAMQIFVVILYLVSTIYAINKFIGSDWIQKRRSIAVLAFAIPIMAFSIMQILTDRNFKSLGWMIAYVLYLFIRMFDMGRAQNKELEHFLRIMDSIKDEYLCIFYVNLDDNKFETYLSSDILRNDFDEKLGEGEYDKMVGAYLEYRVYSPDTDKFRSAMDVNAIKNRLKNINDFIFEYRAYKEGEIANYEAHCWKIKDEKEVKHIVLGFKDVSERKKREFDLHKNGTVMQSLIEGFEYVCYIDFGNETLEEYHVSKDFDYFFNIIGEQEGFKKFDSIFKNGMNENEFEEFRGRFNKDTVQEELADNGSYSVECKMNLGRGLRYYNVKALADKKNPEAVVIGITDVNEQIRAELQKEERAKEREYSIQLETTIAERTAELHDKAKSLNQINEDIIELLGNITEARDVESGEHIRRVKGFTNILARHIMEMYPEYGLDEEKIALITSASALHDVGKIMISDSILLKPGRFTPEEFEVMKTHCENGCRILEKAPKGWDESYLRFSLEICKNHHEKWDGKGYPQGLKEDEIPISAQIVSIADCFDALTTKRVYKDAYTIQDAYDMILNGECGQFSPKILEAFKSAKDEFIAQFESKKEFYSARSLNSHALSDISILLVEDNELTRKITTEILEEEGAKVTAVKKGEEAIEDLENKENIDYDAILMDLLLPDMDGWDVARKIKDMDKARASEVPIIAISSNSDENIKQKAFEAGMVAFIPKPVSVSSLTKILIKSMRSEQDSLKKRLEEVVKRANNDPLTGVKNITAYTEAVGELTRRIADKEEPEFAIVMCDINHLKLINDTFGHNMGDKYIKNCSRLICKTYAHSPVYRIGGDEFAVILTGEDYAKRNELIDDLGERIVKAAAADSIDNGKASLAVGMSVFNPYTDFSVASVTKRADDSMYVNKRMMEYEGNYNS